MKKKYAIIAIGYNRANSMQRLLNSLAKAEYDEERVTLIISIDNSGQDDVIKCAEGFQWPYGEKRIVTYVERQGLRNHILKCGAFLNEFDAVAVLEDDIVVAKSFYQFMKMAVEKYYDDERVAGISLYKRMWNTNVNLPFEPATSKYDGFFVQYAESWGQIWMKKQWTDFAEWYHNNCEEFSCDEKIPEFVSKWPKTSWLKYHIKYCVDNSKYFIYPYASLSTCFSDVGEHTEEKLSYLQVPLLEGIKKYYDLPELSDVDVVKYDSFFEREIDTGKLGEIEFGKVCFDLYGSKRNFGVKRYVLSSQDLPYHCVDSFGMEYTPHESNILYDFKGKEFKLYDTESADFVSATSDGEIRKFLYYFRLYRRDRMFIKCILWRTKQKIKRIIARLM